MKFAELFDADYNPIWERIEIIPEFAILKETKQNQIWHQEGCVFNHIKLTCEAMHKRLHSISFKEGDKLFFMASALCHDLGKATTTYFSEEDNDYHCKDHGRAGEKIVRNLFFDEETYFRERVCAMVRNHMAMHQIVQHKSDFSRVIKLSYCGVTVNELIEMYISDSLGSINEETEEYVLERAKNVRDWAKNERCLYQPNFFITWEGKYGYFLNYTPDDTEFTMYVTIGVPGAGKDYWVDKNLPKVVKISRDEIRTQIGLEGEKTIGNKAQEKRVTEIAHDEILKCCGKRKSFVIADTNTHKHFRQELTKLVFPYHPKVVYVYIDTPIELCKERRKEQMPLEVIDRMWNQMDVPTLEECDELKFEKGY